MFTGNFFRVLAKRFLSVRYLKLLPILLLAFSMASITESAMASASGQAVEVVQLGQIGDPAFYGLSKLKAGISAKGFVVKDAEQSSFTAPYAIVAGLASESAIAEKIIEAGLDVPSVPEALAVLKTETRDREILYLCGADDVGLMYAALDAAERLFWDNDGESLFADIENISEEPFLVDRSVSTYTMQRKWFEQRLYDPEYWDTYFDLLAKNRINSFVIIFGYECGGFMAPLYPYFFDVEGFPEVELVGLSEEQQTKNREAMQRLIRSAHQRGIRITLGIWDHIYRGGVQGGGIEGASDLVGKRTPHLVYGVTTDNLADYTKAALKKLLNVFPEIDAIQFRMHWESGLTREETPKFWHEVFSMLRELKPGLTFDLRAKGLPDVVIEDAIEQQVPFRITTKYWMEQLGMPFHPVHINRNNQKDRRHGYADLLRYPKQYDMHWRIWSGGTARFLLWGDPAYVRQFVRSARVYGGNSFEVNEMLATKMLAAPHDEAPFQLHTPEFRHYRYEFERYWHYYQVWGRVSYNPNTSSEYWRREFQARYGNESGIALMKGLHRASWILPRIVAASYNYRFFPTTRGWAEMMRLGDLDFYADGTGTDIELFQSYKAAASQLIEGDVTTLVSPQQTAEWFETVADSVLIYASNAEAGLDKLEDNRRRELAASGVDLKILASLARYHANRMRAAIWYNIFKETDDSYALSMCRRSVAASITAWEEIIESAEGVYSDRLQFGVHSKGFPHHWREELPLLRRDLEKLAALKGTSSLTAEDRIRLVKEIESPRESAARLNITCDDKAIPGRAFQVHVKSSEKLQSVRLRYRHLTQFEDYLSVEMKKTAPQEFTAEIPADFITSTWDLIFFVEAVDTKGVGFRAPDFSQGMPYIIVGVTR